MMACVSTLLCFTLLLLDAFCSPDNINSAYHITIKARGGDSEARLHTVQFRSSLTDKPQSWLVLSVKTTARHNRPTFFFFNSSLLCRHFLSFEWIENRGECSNSPHASAEDSKLTTLGASEVKETPLLLSSLFKPHQNNPNISPPQSDRQPALTYEKQTLSLSAGEKSFEFFFLFF